MVIFNSYVSHYQRVCVLSSEIWCRDCFHLMSSPNMRAAKIFWCKPHCLSHPYFSPSAPTGVGLRFGLANDMLMIGVHLTKPLDVPKQRAVRLHMFGVTFDRFGVTNDTKNRKDVCTQFFVGYHPLYSWANLQYHTALRTATPLICININ